MMNFRHSSVRRLVLAVGLSAVLATPVAVASRTSFDRIVVFGTSLSDPGNAFALLGATNVPPDYTVDPFLVPDRPYARGGQHFSNGATWIEQFGTSVGLAGSVLPAFRGSGGPAANFAVGAARAYDDGINVNLSVQVSTFLQRSAFVAPSDALYVIEMGGNDVRDALVAFPGGGSGAIISASLASIGGHIGTLYAAGARKFLVWNVPNVALTPAIRALDAVSPGAAALAGFLTQTYNAGLDSVLTLLSALPGIEIVRFDAYQTLSDIAADPAAFELTNVTTACITPGVPPFVCSRPDTFLFWDGIHPTKAVHAILAQGATDLLVP
jgi:phospholipase/lecithinase/hemolysin